MSHDASDQASPPAAPAPTTRRDFLVQTGTGLLALAAGGGALGGAGAPARAATPSEWLSVTDFGVRGDGVTDDSAALIRLRDYMRRSPDTHFHVYVKPSLVVVVNTLWWIRQVMRVTFEAYGAKFKNIYPNALIGHHHLFDDSPSESYYDPIPGHRFSGASAGATSITLTNPADAAQFAVGGRIFLWGFDQQYSGIPPNMRHFEWNKITAVNGATGVLTLATPLQLDYDNEWWDIDAGGGFYNLPLGKPRAIPLDRTNYKYPYHVEFLGAEFISSPSVAVDAVLPIADFVRLADCIGDEKMQFICSEQRHVVYENVTCQAPTTELDKLCELVHIKGGEWNRIDAATGVRRIYLEGASLSGGIGISPRRLDIERCTFNLPAGAPIGAIGLAWGGWNTRQVSLSDNQFQHASVMGCILNTDVVETLTVDGYASGEILLNDTNPNRTHLNCMDIGTILYRPDGSDFGRISRLRWTGTQFALAGNWRGPFAPGTTLFYHKYGTATEAGSTFVGGDPYRVLRDPRAAHMVPDARGKRILTIRKFDFSASQQEFEIFGFLKSITLTCTSPFGSTVGSGFTISAYTQSWNDVTHFMGYYTHIAGTATVTETTTSASPTGATWALTPIPAGRFYRTFRLSYPNPDLAPLQLPVLSVTIEMEPPAV